MRKRNYLRLCLIIIPIGMILGCISIQEKIDSDKDGWTDDYEKSIGTDPFSKDTDKDGIPDPEDPDPLVPEEKVKPPIKKLILSLPEENLPQGVECDNCRDPIVTFPSENIRHVIGVYSVKGVPSLYVHIIEGLDNATVKSAMNLVLKDMGISGNGKPIKINGYNLTFYENTGKISYAFAYSSNRVGLITDSPGTVDVQVLKEVTLLILKGQKTISAVKVTPLSFPKENLPDGVSLFRKPISFKKENVEAKTGIYFVGEKRIFVHIVRGSTLEDTKKEMDRRLSGMGIDKANKSTEKINGLIVTKYKNAAGKYYTFGYIYTWYKGEIGFIVDAVKGVDENTTLAMVKRVMELN
ncbi:MAG: thrombospondin type 3 repeat-containing protein [Candidatus Hydrothermarchaeota archaeon]